MNVKGTEASAVDQGGKRAVDPVRGGAPAGSAANAGAGAAQADSLSISGSARSLANLQAVIAATPDINAGHVERITKALESGMYTVKAARIADRMLQLERDLAVATHPSPR
ncbi:MAG: flagellar biosynthesis anti-sigma factor FlgM [Steroidobacteraceae bacterium]